MWGLPTVSYHLTKFDGHRCCGSSKIGFLNLPRDHVIERSHDFEGGLSPQQVTILPSLVAIGIAEGQIFGFTFVTDCMIKRSVTSWMLYFKPCHISNSNANFNFNVYKLPIFSLNHVHLSAAPFEYPCKKDQISIFKFIFR